MNDSTLPSARCCRACGSRIPSGSICPECEAAHCGKAACNALLDAVARPANCPACGVWTVFNRQRERVGLRGRHAVAERRQAADALVPDILAEHGIEVDKATAADRADADALAEARVLRRKGFDVAMRFEPDSEAGRDGLRQWSAGFDREMRRSVMLRARQPEPEPAGGRITGVEWVIVEPDGSRRDMARYQQPGTTPTDATTLSITRVIVDPDPANYAPTWAHKAIHPEQHTPVPAEVFTSEHQYQPEPEPVIEAVIVAPERKPARLTPAQHARLLAQQTRGLS